MAWLNENAGAVTGLAAVAGVVVTALYAFFTVLLWLATRRQAELTRTIFESTHRPYISIQPRLLAAASPSVVRLDFELKNHGSSPALVTEWNVRLSQETKELVNSNDVIGNLCVFPGSTEVGPSLQLDGADAAAVWQANPPPTLAVRVRYLGAGPTQRYATAFNGRVRVAGTHALILEGVRHGLE